MEIIKDSAGNEVVLMGTFDRQEVLTDVSGESMTKQSFKDECDINVILARYERSGQLPLSDVPGMFGDFSGSVDFHQSMNSVKKAEEAFIQNVPAAIRARFNNDPGLFLDFVNNPSNREELVKLGLAVEKPPAKAEAVVTPAPVAEVPK